MRVARDWVVSLHVRAAWLRVLAEDEWRLLLRVKHWQVRDEVSLHANSLKQVALGPRLVVL